VLAKARRGFDDGGTQSLPGELRRGVEGEVEVCGRERR
jgi:hypothetical protein